MTREQFSVTWRQADKIAAWIADVDGIGRLCVTHTGKDQFTGYVTGRRVCVLPTLDTAKQNCERVALERLREMVTK